MIWLALFTIANLGTLAIFTCSNGDKWAIEIVFIAACLMILAAALLVGGLQ